ncbi:MAG: hypothetical protein GX265_04070 [Mollicutes bacterium]|jgi:RNA polymerase sporulation-specific sigma factor|nr:hypothetical protein [Mollicutes bacterium]
MEYNDVELVQLVKENNDDAKDTIYEKYKYIIDIIIAKYKKVFYVLGMDLMEVRQDAMLAFSDALVSYSSEKETTLATFISLVIERKIQNCIRKADTIKNKKNNENYSLDYEYEIYNKPLSELIGDPNADPLVKVASKEAYEELVAKIKAILSPMEYEVYKLLISGFSYIDIAKILKKEPKQIDNTIQRLRTKVKELIYTCQN